MKKDVELQHHKTFEEIKQIDKDGIFTGSESIYPKSVYGKTKLPCQINPIETYQYPTPAKRPHYSLLNKSKIKSAFNIEIPYWKDGLDDCLRRLGERR